MKENLSFSEVFKKQFAERLLGILNKKGYKNSRKPYFVDIMRFAEIIEVTPAMLRRYLSGEALPNDTVIEKAAAELNVDPLWLFSGWEPPREIDVKLMSTIMKKLIRKSETHNIEEIVTYGCEMYNRLQNIEATNETEKYRLISWMTENLPISHTEHKTEPLKTLNENS